MYFDEEQCRIDYAASLIVCEILAGILDQIRLRGGENSHTTYANMVEL